MVVPIGVVTPRFLTATVAVLETFSVAVMVVEFTTVKLLEASVTPLGSPVSPVAPVRLVPASVIGTVIVPVAGCVAEFGLIEVSVGPTVKGIVLLAEPAPATVTATFWAPTEAVLEMVRVAVKVLELVTLTPLTVTPVPETDTVVSPAMKLVPVSVTGTVVPRTPVGGLTVINVGVGGIVTAKATGLLTPPGAVTVMLLVVPEALAAMVKVVETWLSLTTLIAPTVTPLPGGTLTAVAPVNPLPKISTATAAPCPRSADDGVMDVSTGPSTV